VSNKAELEGMWRPDSAAALHHGEQLRTQPHWGFKALGNGKQSGLEAVRYPLNPQASLTTPRVSSVIAETFGRRLLSWAVFSLK